MNAWSRFWIGGGGALLPLLVTLLAVDLAPLIDNGLHLSFGTYVGTVIRYALLFTIGGVVAALNSDEVQPIKLVQLGIAAPALISTYVNAQAPKPPPTRTAAVHTRVVSFDLISSAGAAEAGARDNAPMLMADFLSDVFRSAIAPLPREIQAPAPSALSVEDKAAVDRAIESARASALAAERAASEAAKLDHQTTPAAISSVQKSADDARAAAKQTQSDIKTLEGISKMGVTAPR